MIQDWVAGETGPREFTLYQNGAVFPIPGAATVTLVLINGRDKVTVIPTTGDVTVTDGPNGKVQFTPDSTDLVATDSPLLARWVVTVGGFSAYFPTGLADTWVIHAI
jgi:hypothetical protein